MENNNQNNSNEVTPEVKEEAVVNVQPEEPKVEEVKAEVKEEPKKENNYNKDNRKDNKKEKPTTINVYEIPKVNEKPEKKEEGAPVNKIHIVNIESYSYIIALGGIKGPIYNMELHEDSIKELLLSGELINKILPSGKRFYIYIDADGKLITE